MIDSGATNNSGGANTSDDIQDNLADNDVDPTSQMKLDTQDTKEFGFGNDKTGSGAGLMTFRLSLLGKDVADRTYLCDGGAPWLGSIAFLFETNATINFKTGIAQFGALDPDHHYLLKRMSSGYLGLALHDPGDRHPKVHVKDPTVEQLASLAEQMSASGLSN